MSNIYIREFAGKFLTRPRFLAPLFVLVLWPVGVMPGQVNGGGTSAIPLLKTSILGVQLYSSQAQVSRVGKTGLKKGANELKIVDLPPALLDDSIQVRFRNARGLKIQDIRVDNTHQKVYQSAAAKTAEANLRKAESRLRELTDRYRNLKEEESYLRRISLAKIPPGKKEKARPIEPARWRESLDFIQSAMRKNHQSLQTLLETIDVAREELNVALTVSDRYQSAKFLRKKSVYIKLKSSQARDCNLTLEYRIRGAGWYPRYSARVVGGGESKTKARVRLLGYGLVYNRTGEDWKNVRLNFSAANPGATASLPELYEWRIKGRVVAVVDEEKSEERENDVAPAAEPRRSPRRSSASSGKSRRGFNRSPRRDVIRRKKIRPAQEQSAGESQAMNLQRRRSSSYYTQNKTIIKEKRAQKKSLETERSLKGLRSNLTAQDRNFTRGQYSQALRNSERVLYNLRNLSPRYRKVFKQEEQKANEIRLKSLKFIEQKRLRRKLIAPASSAGGFDYRYRALIRETIKNDGTFHKVLFYKSDLPVRMVYETAPVAKKRVYLNGMVRYKGATPLLAGPVSVFYHTDYTGESRMPNVDSKADFRLPLGDDENIKVVRDQKEFRVKSGVFSSSYVYDKTITVDLINNNKRSVEIYVFDRIPVARDDKIKIENITLSPGADKKDAKAGLYRFRLKLGAGQKKSVQIKYRLSHPEKVLPQYRRVGTPGW